MKKLIFLFILTVLPCMAWADDSGSCGDNVTYYFEEETGTLTISGTGAMSDNRYSWGFYAPWYSYKEKIKICYVMNGVSSIGKEAFYQCSSLTSIEIPNGVTSIGNEAFRDCSSLTSVTIPNSVTNIGEWSFCGCSSLTSVTIPNGVTSIGYGTFKDCSSLSSVTIPNSVTNIGNSAFSGCSSLTSVDIPNSVRPLAIMLSQAAAA